MIPSVQFLKNCLFHVVITLPLLGQEPPADVPPIEEVPAESGGDFLAPFIPTEPETAVSTLDTLVVSASKLDQTLAESTGSIGRISSERIEKAQLRTANDAYRLLGNVSAPQFVDGGFVIRGMNSEAPDAENITGDQAPLSTIFVDGVALGQQAARRGPTGLWDVQSIEVFRGPQSTLQGKNALAGSVNIRTRDPVFDWEGATRLTYGNFNTEEQAIMLNVPATDFLAFRFAAENASSESFVNYPGLTNFSRYQDFITSENLSFRAKALLAPKSSPFTSKLTYTFSENRRALADIFGPSADPTVSSFDQQIWLSNSPSQQIRESRNQSLAWENVYALNETLRLTALSTGIHTALNVGQIDGQNVRDDTERELTQEIRLNWDGERGKAVIGLFGSYSDFESTQVPLGRDRSTLALFGEADILLHPSWFLIAGGRVHAENYNFGDGTATYEDTIFLPKIGLRHEFQLAHTLGLTYQQGFQSGGAGADANNIPFIFDPSTTHHIELSYRNSFFDDKLTLSANAFHTDWKDQQVVLRTVDPSTFNASEIVVNASESRIYGGEIELAAKPTDKLQIFSSIGLLSTQYDDFTLNIDPTVAAAFGVPANLDYSGYEFPESPSLNFSLGFDYRFADGFFLAADAAYSASYYSPALFAPTGSGVGLVSVQVPQDKNIEIASFITVNLSGGYEREDWKLSLFVNNLFDERHVIGKVPNAVPNASGGIDFQDNFLATAGAPRTFGAALEFSF